MAEADPQIANGAEAVAPLTPAFAVRLESILRVKAFISSEETRYYLNGVHVEPCPTGGAVCVSTDGHRLGIQRDPEGLVIKSTIVKLPAEIKLPKPLRRGVPVKAWLVCMSHGGRGHVSIVPAGPHDHDTPENAIARVDDCLLRVGHAVIDGTYPDWRRVVPKEKTETFERGFNSKYLGDFGGNITINGTDPAAPHIVQTQDREFVGVIMPVRTIAAPLPEWLTSAQVPA